MEMANKMKKVLIYIVAVLFSLVSLNAASLVVNDGDVVKFSKIELKGITVYEEGYTNADQVVIYPGEEFSLKVKYKGIQDDEKVRFRVTLQGYDYDVLEEVTKDTFEVVAGKYDLITANIKLPKDLESGEYVLQIEFIGSDNSDYIEIPLDVEKPVKSILDVSINALPPIVKVGSCEDCGKVKVLARIENRGKNTLKHINVEAYLKEYPTLTKTIVYLYQNRDDEFNGVLEPGDVASLEGYVDLNQLPVAPKSGTYTLVVKVNYDYNHKSIIKEFPIQIFNVDEYLNKNKKEEKKTEEKVSASKDSIEMSVSDLLVQLNDDVKEKEITVNLKNKEESRLVLAFDVEASGLNVELEPAKITIPPLEEAQIKLKVSAPNEGIYPIKLKVMNDKGTVIAEKTIMVEADYNNFDLANLLIALIVIVLVLIIAVIIAIIFKSNKGNNNGGLVKEKTIVEKNNNVKVEEDELY